jgi:hypothetical protein
VTEYNKREFGISIISNFGGLPTTPGTKARAAPDRKKLLAQKRGPRRTEKNFWHKSADRAGPKKTFGTKARAAPDRKKLLAPKRGPRRTEKNFRHQSAGRAGLKKTPGTKARAAPD